MRIGTVQEMFDTVVTALRKQGESSIGRGTCLYRGPRGLKCAAGHLIPDNLYESRIEDVSVRILHYRGLFTLEQGYTPEHMDVLALLQQIHDRASVDTWESEWTKLAARASLQYTPPEVSNESK